MRPSAHRPSRPGARALPNLAALASRTPSTTHHLEERRRLTQLLSSQRDEHRVVTEKLEHELREKIKRNQDRRQAFDREVQLLTDRISRQQAQIDSLSRRAAPPAAAHSLNDASVERLESAREIADLRIEDLGRALAAARQTLKETKERAKALPHAHVIDALAQEKAKLDRSRESEIAQLQPQIVEATARIDGLGAHIAAATARAEALQTENTGLVGEMERIESAIRSVRAECARLRAQIDNNGPMIPFEHVHLQIAQMEEERRRTIEKRRQELQTRLDAATGSRDRMKRELDRRLEIIEELNQKVIDLTHQAAEAKEEAEREMQTMKRAHQTEVRALREKLNAELEAALEVQQQKMRAAVDQVRRS
jgi:chromosome segregation ATPase